MMGPPGGRGGEGGIAQRGPMAPEAMPAAPDGDNSFQSKATGGSNMAGVGRTRTVFPETWLWTENEAG